ncbi:EAL domain-containing protein [Sulfurimonas sp.]|nr:EAL domain-containing protein [Sulfurimonas sp.]
MTNSKLSLKLLLLTLMFSTLITLVITSIQLYIDYKNGYKKIVDQVAVVESSYVDILNESIWVYDITQVEIQLRSIVNLPDVEFVKLSLSDNTIIDKGEHLSDNYLERSIPLSYRFNNQKTVLGELYVVADLNRLYDNMVDKVSLILLSQATKTFLTSFFILFIFNMLVTVHIKRIVEYTKSIDVNEFIKPLKLNKKRTASRYDEIDNLSDVINATYAKLFNSHQDLVDELSKRIDTEKLLLKKKQELVSQYTTDKLTGLSNRSKLLEDIVKLHVEAIAIVDIDDFREVNDFYGETIGDLLIGELAKRLNNLATQDNLKLYRLQADQFVLACIESTNQEKFEQVILDINQRAVKDSFNVKQYEVLIMTTIGVAFGSENTLIDADIALKIAKKSKKHFVTYSKDFAVEEEFRNNLEWTKKLKKAIDEERITAYFQPIYSHATNRIEKYEALVRMIGEDSNPISPFHFLDIAFKTKLYPQITRIMIDKVVEVALSHHDYEFSINFEIEDLLNTDTMSYFLNKLKESNVGERLVVEVVESQGIEDFDAVKTVVDWIKAFGCKLSIDDFGTGYSNFEYLLKLKADYVKIDASLIKHIDKDEDMLLVTKNIVSFSNISNMKTIAEFVCSKEINDIAIDIGIDYSQGYYIGEPIPSDKVGVV